MARQRLTDRSVTKKPPSKGQLELWDTVLPGFGLRISYGGRRTFFIMTRIYGRQVRRTVGTYPVMSLAEARGRARDILSDAAKGIDPKEKVAEERRTVERARRNSFRSVAEEFMVDHGKNLRTAREYQRKLDSDILPQWGSRPIDQITRADVKALVRAKAREAPISANRVSALISKIFNWAIDEEIVDASPAVRITAEPEVERERVLTDDELARVWKAADALGYPFGHVIKLLILTGQRRGEVVGMKWPEIDGDEWRIPGERAKKGKGHMVPLTPLALEILGSVPKVSAEYVFTTLGDRPVSGWSRAKRRCDKFAGFTDWRMHDIRRTVATGLRSLGIDRLVVSKILNHAEGGITRIYDRYSADPEKRRALDAWSQHVESIISGKSAPSNVVELHQA